MSKQNVSDFIIQRLIDWKVERVYGYSGDGINGAMAALRRKREFMEFIQTRHEESAAFMACAHSKFTGNPGVCIATGGPGAIHLLNGLYDAKLDHQPVVAIVGQKPRHAMGSNSLQEVNLSGLFADVSEYVETINVPEQAPVVMDRALRIAQDRRGVCTVILPSDVQTLDMPSEIEPAHDVARSATGYARPKVIPQKSDLAIAAEILNSGKRVAILAGAGCLEASKELEQVAEKLQAGVAKALLGKAVLPDDRPFVTGCIGLLGTEPSAKMMKECDTLLMVGTSFPYTEFLPDNGQARGVQIDIQGKSQSVFYPMEKNLTGDAKSTLAELLPLLETKKRDEWREGIEANVADWWKKLEERAHQKANPINPQRVFWELSSRLPDKAILCADSGTAANWFARDIKIREGMKASLSGKLASMCPAVPYAIAAKMAYPDRVPFALIGDGAMQMLGITNLITISKYWQSWDDPRLVILVLNNQDLAQVTWEMRAMEGDPKFEASQKIPDMDYAKFARDLGLAGRRTDNPDQIGEIWDEALQADRPFVIDALTDPEVPTIPPHITFEQTKNYLSATLKGDAGRLGFLRQSIRDFLAR
ncbi:thiamine pyrophosphate-requiring protein [Pelagicoccus sp. SDUM812003]|uniref:thiamine pyrophosphate-requiring protein n=1 Tax=Pelagicoccus sp. SDUM812003 TaxID=3041267 RepID=UPI00280F2F51|nr:thiamine pyrophosphate-requiring protein [Pelagicoccus sp. SDUM812003]MDQ8201792.1 thiamine pyrophosphate-requiring protein [Pelagicoccus sp. SDUM812003]